jgi:quercetin dioxygenase-like cupin family protein
MLFATLTVAAPQLGTTGNGTSNIPFSTLTFSPLSEQDPEGPGRAIAFGDPDQGAHGFYIRLPAGFVSPLHYHTADYNAVVIEGTVVNNYEGQEQEVVLTPGGYFATRGGVNHVTKCLSETACIMYIQMNRAFDSIPA